MEKKHTIAKVRKSPNSGLGKSPESKIRPSNDHHSRGLWLACKKNAKRLNTCSQKMNTTKILKETTKQKITKPLQSKQQQSERTPLCWRRHPLRIRHEFSHKQKSTSCIPQAWAHPTTMMKQKLMQLHTS